MPLALPKDVAHDIISFQINNLNFSACLQDLSNLKNKKIKRKTSQFSFLCVYLQNNKILHT